MNDYYDIMNFIKLLLLSNCCWLSQSLIAITLHCMIAVTLSVAKTKSYRSCLSFCLLLFGHLVSDCLSLCFVIIMIGWLLLILLSAPYNLHFHRYTLTSRAHKMLLFENISFLFAVVDGTSNMRK